MHRTLDRKKCKKIYRTEGKIHRILEDERENEPNPARKSRGQKEKCTEF
jgi:hypothetical protein